MNELNAIAKILRRHQVPKASAGNPTHPEVKTSSAEVTDRVTLSRSSREASENSSAGKGSDIRLDLVNKFRQTLKDGEYEVKASEIADKIVQKIRENKNHTLLY